MYENKVIHNPERHIILPGGFYFGGLEDDIYTLLGSCVAVTLWHPVLKLAGMCHILLPKRGDALSSTRFADCAIKNFLKVTREHNTTPAEYEVGLYGGGDMFPLVSKTKFESVGSRNVKEMERLLILEGFRIKYKDTQGQVARKLTLNRLTGSISLEYVEMEN